MISDIDLLYRQHLTPSDLGVLDAVASAPAGRPPASDIGPIESALGRPELEGAVFPAEGDRPLAATSPFLTFAVAVHRTHQRLQDASYVEERWAPRRRVPVFDVEPLRAVLSTAERRFFLVELLASYTHVSSGVTWQRTRRGWRRRRFSELDPVRLAELLAAMPSPERAGIYRRLGDLALFLTGVFPDHRSVIDLGPVAIQRLSRLSGVADAIDPDSPPAGLLETLGQRWYSLAVRSARAHAMPVTGALTTVEEIARRFSEARRVLNVVTDWYLFPLRERWFGVGS